MYINIFVFGYCYEYKHMYIYIYMCVCVCHQWCHPSLQYKCFHLLTFHITCNCNCLSSIPRAIEVTSVINIPASGGRRRLVYQIYPPAIDTLVTGMAWVDKVVLGHPRQLVDRNRVDRTDLSNV